MVGKEARTILKNKNKVTVQRIRQDKGFPCSEQAPYLSSYERHSGSILAGLSLGEDYTTDTWGPSKAGKYKGLAVMGRKASD